MNASVRKGQRSPDNTKDCNTSFSQDAEEKTDSQHKEELVVTSDRLKRFGILCVSRYAKENDNLATIF